MISYIFSSIGYLINSVINAPLPYLFLQALLFLVLFWAFRKNKNTQVEKPKLSREEEDEIIKKWRPKPLVDSKNNYSNGSLPEPDEEKIWGPIEGRPGKYVQIGGVNYLNMVTHNYLGLVEEPKLDIEAERCIKKYGVGSCGPRGFYGTVDVHLELEDNITKFMKMGETCLYSYGFQTIASAIPSYAKNDDIIFTDEYVSFSIQKGIQVSKSQINYFKHNDVKDLERLFKEQARFDAMNSKKAKTIRKFCIVEGIYMKTGELCPLYEINRLCREYKVRLFVDETISFGTIGQTGRGVSEHYNVPVEDLDMICGSLEHSMAAYGGFVVGPSYVVDHQRISGLGYCFSASLPPLLAGAGIQSLKILENNPIYVQDLQENSQYLHKLLKSLQGFNLSGHPISPLKHLSLKKTRCSRGADKALLNKVIIHVKENAKIALIQPSCIEDMEVILTAPSIRLTINRLLTKADMNSVVEALKKAQDALNL